MATDPEGPLLIVGWDAGTFEIIDDFRDDLDTLSALIDGGSSGDLRTVHPPGTIPGWPCITTGMNPGKINTQRLAPFRQDEFQPNTGEENVELWDVVDHGGGTSCVVNIPTVVDAYDIDGCMVAGFMSTEESTTVSPADLLDELDTEADLHLSWESADSESELFTAAMDVAERRFALVGELMAIYDWDLFIVNFDAPDRIMHSRLKYTDPEHPFYTEKGNRQYGDDVRDCFVRLDEMLADLVPEDGSVFVISDHGMEPCHYRFHINNWLLDEGYLVLEGGDGTPSTTGRLFSAAKNFVVRNGLVDYVPDFLKRKSVVGAMEGSKHISEAAVDWDATTASMSAVYGGIDVLAEGEERERVKAELAEKLEALEEPRTRVVDSRELYHGPNIENVPDLFLEFEDYILPSNQVGASSLLEPSSTGGKHSMDGIFVAAGEGIRKTGEIEGATVMDVTPTALHLLGYPIPEDVDGEVLDVLETEREPVYEDLDIDVEKGRVAMSEAEKEEVMETLEDIGYM